MASTADAALTYKVRRTIAELGGDPEQIVSRNLPFYADAEHLVVADTSRSGIEHRLTAGAARAWAGMKTRASEQNVSLILISGFRSFDRQFTILRHRVEAGEPIEDLLAVLAPPGCSQHHTGRALDIGTLGCEPASRAFADTAAFEWLIKHAADFGFSLSYPEDNPYGYHYEPWHWYLHEADV